MRKYLKWILITLLVLLVIIAVYPFVVGDMETLVMDDTARASMQDLSFVKLSDGYTHCEWGGPENGRPIVLLCGSLTPMSGWDSVFSALANAGFHVLRYDYFGRGLSDHPEYTSDLYEKQLLELLDSQGVKEKVDVVGSSLGGALAIRFTDRHPERVRRFALLAPAGFPAPVPLNIRIACWPFAGEWIFKAVGDKAIPAAVLGWVKDPEEKHKLMQKLQQQMRYRGFKRSFLATMRDNSYFDMKKVYERVGTRGIKGILFWGTEDDSFNQHPLVQSAIPSIEFHIIEGGTHYLPPEKVTPLLIEFLKR
jgi:pimeloyl-ACP methyl ester carboxylesterase